VTVLPGEVDGIRFLRNLARFGWVVSRVKGSHRVLRRADGKVLIVAFHGTLSRNSVRRALRDAGIDEDEFTESL
jgi:predicted RNA binding protein YcfA (HicA-like mRNA interferase family)